MDPYLHARHRHPSRVVFETSYSSDCTHPRKAAGVAQYGMTDCSCGGEKTGREWQGGVYWVVEFQFIFTSICYCSKGNAVVEDLLFFKIVVMAWIIVVISSTV